MTQRLKRLILPLTLLFLGACSSDHTGTGATPQDCKKDEELVNGSCQKKVLSCEERPCTDNDGCCASKCMMVDSDCKTDVLCGNGKRDPNEKCETSIAGSCPDAATCAARQAPLCQVSVLVGTGCQQECGSKPLTECINDDGCCPDSCTFATDNDCLRDDAKELGGACIRNNECKTRYCRTEDSDGSFWDGMCTVSCLTMSCPAGSVCITRGTDDANCHPLCDDTNKCRDPHYECVAEPGGKKYCEVKIVPDCTDTSCPTGEVCRKRFGSKRKACVDASRQVGQPCTSDDDCDGFCIVDSPQAGGYCSDKCGEKTPCPDGSKCDTAKDKDGKTILVCKAECKADTDCRAGYHCKVVGAHTTDPYSVCW